MHISTCRSFVNKMCIEGVECKGLAVIIAVVRALTFYGKNGPLSPLTIHLDVLHVKYCNMRKCTYFPCHSTDGTFTKERNTTNPLGYKGRLVDSFASLLKKLWTGQHQKLSPHSVLVTASISFVFVYMCFRTHTHTHTRTHTHAHTHTHTHTQNAYVCTYVYRHSFTRTESDGIQI